MGLTWREDFDDEDNSIWEAASCFTTDSDPLAVPDVFWRLRQLLRNNRIEWVPRHDAELGGDTGEMWLTLEEAKAAIQETHDAVVASQIEELCSD